MGFTLTMWDVKSGSANEGFATSLGFTLTMWDVKVFTYNKKSIPFTFYLNYVGCKAFRYRNTHKI